MGDRLAAPDARVTSRSRTRSPIADNGRVESTSAMAAPDAPRDVVILGSTGSIGTQALDIVRRNPGRFRVVALAAGGGNPGLLASQAAEFGVAAVAVADPAALAAVEAAIDFEWTGGSGGSSPRASRAVTGRG